MNLTRTKVALIAGAASALTTAMHGAVQAITTYDYNALQVLAHVTGRVVGDFPSALICFGLTYGILRAKNIGRVGHP